MRRPALTKKVVESLVQCEHLLAGYFSFEEDQGLAERNAGIVEGCNYISSLIKWHMSQEKNRQQRRMDRLRKKHLDAAEATYQREQKLKRKNAEENRSLGFIKYAEELERQLEEEPATWAEYIAQAEEEVKA